MPGTMTWRMTIWMPRCASSSPKARMRSLEQPVSRRCSSGSACLIHQVRVGEHGVEALGMARVERVAAAIQAGVDAPVRILVRRAEQIGQERGLQQGLAAGDRDAAGLVERAVALEAAEQMLHAHLGTGVRAGIPGIRVVTVLAAHGATLREHDEPDAGPVHGAHRLDGVNPAQGVVRGSELPLVQLLKRYLRHGSLPSSRATF